MLNVQHARPSPELAPYVYGYVLRVSDPREPEVVEPVVSRSGSMLEFQFGDQYDVPVYGLDRPNPSNPITVIGPIPARNVRVVIRGRVEALAVLFRPLGFYAIFGIPHSPFTGIGTEGGGVLGVPVRRLYQHLGNLRSFPDRIQSVERFLLQHLHRGQSLHRAHRALSVLVSPGRQSMVHTVAAQAGISTRQLERISLESIGVSPILLARLTRFQQALRLRQQTAQSWAWIAQAADYHDQMHMIRDFRSLAGDTPERAMAKLAPEHLISFMCG